MIAGIKFSEDLEDNLFGEFRNKDRITNVLTTISVEYEDLLNFMESISNRNKLYLLCHLGGWREVRGAKQVDFQFIRHQIAYEKEIVFKSKSIISKYSLNHSISYFSEQKGFFTIPYLNFSYLEDHIVDIDLYEILPLIDLT